MRNNGGSPGKRLGLKKFSGKVSSTIPDCCSLTSSLWTQTNMLSPATLSFASAAPNSTPGKMCVLPSSHQPHLTVSSQVAMGRDHTIYATVPGFVRFYKEKWMSSQRRYVGIVLNRGEKLPRDEAALGRSRYCGLVNLTPIRSASSALDQ